MRIIFFILYAIVNLLIIITIMSFSGVKSGASNFVSSITDRAVGSSSGLRFSYILISVLGAISLACTIYLMYENNQYLKMQEGLQYETDTQINEPQSGYDQAVSANINMKKTELLIAVQDMQVVSYCVSTADFMDTLYDFYEMFHYMTLPKALNFLGSLVKSFCDRKT